ncbi:hypothetical protein [Levilactobacillus wangkuiensis]|uniref:hypothetical protein n=1 Tax=Levilactobacillus wangkuiensis TaxID=2799566 RepID=UPI001941FA3C|nr:hypothetical protein [Levilactobacillus wangkuiensis]
MRVKQIVIIAIAALGLTLAGGQVANASVHYTNGMPKQLVGKYWRSKIKRGTGRDGYPKGYPKFLYAHGTKHSFRVKASMAEGLGIYKHVSYYKDGARHWYLAEDNIHQAGGDYDYFEVKLSKSRKTLTVSNLFFDKDWNSHRTYTKMHRFTHFPKWHGHAAK